MNTRYFASLRLRHPSIAAAEISNRMKVTPSGSWTCGDERFSPNGEPLPGRHRFTGWRLDVKVRQGLGIEETITSCAKKYGPRLAKWPEFSNSGGEADFFVSLLVRKHLGIELDVDLMTLLSSFKISLALDVYPEDELERKYRAA